MKTLLSFLLAVSLVANICLLSGCCTVYVARQPEAPEVKVVRDNQFELTKNWSDDQKNCLKELLDWVERSQGHSVLFLDKVTIGNSRTILVRFTDVE